MLTILIHHTPLISANKDEFFAQPQAPSIWNITEPHPLKKHAKISQKITEMIGHQSCLYLVTELPMHPNYKGDTLSVANSHTSQMFCWGKGTSVSSTMPTIHGPCQNVCTINQIQVVVN